MGAIVAGFVKNVILLVLLSPSIISQSCDFYQEMKLGQEYYIYNKEYPNPYGRNQACRWVATTVPYAKITLTCDVVEIPWTSGCQGDHLAVSLTGDPSLTDSEWYCGSGKLNLVSKGNSLTVGLFSTWNSQGGKFACTIKAVSDCDCGWTNMLKIVGGHDTMVNEYPMMAALIDARKKIPVCGATIISEDYALTAAHCFENQDIASTGLLVGDHNISSGTDTPYAALYKLAGVAKHPGYDFKTLANDIAVIKTVNRMKLSMYVGPVCLPFRFTNANFVGQPVTVLGWGLTQLSGHYSDTLQEADLNVIDNNQCKAQITDRPVTDKEICAYGVGKDACTGDSGGPLLWMDPTRHRSYLVGIISFGRGCGLRLPNVNTKVAEYLQWIEQTATGAKFCYN